MGYWLPAVWFHFPSVIKYVVEPASAGNEIWMTMYLSQPLLFAKTTKNKYLGLKGQNICSFSGLIFLSQWLHRLCIWASRLGTGELSLAVSSLQLFLVPVCAEGFLSRVHIFRSVLFPHPSAHEENVKVAQSCPTLCDLMDYTVHGIFQARVLEWAAFPFSRGSSQPRDGTQVSRTANGCGFFTSWATREAPWRECSLANRPHSATGGPFSPRPFGGLRSWLQRPLSAPSVWPGSPPPRAVLRSMLLLAPLTTTISPVCRTAISFTTMPREIARRRLSSPRRPRGPGVGQCVVCSARCWAVTLCACAFHTAPPPPPMGLRAWMPLDSAVPGGHAVRMRFRHTSPPPTSHGSPRPDGARLSFHFSFWSSFLQYALQLSLPSHLIISYFAFPYVLLRPSFFTILRLYSLVT